MVFIGVMDLHKNDSGVKTMKRTLSILAILGIFVVSLYLIQQTYYAGLTWEALLTGKVFTQENASDLGVLLSIFCALSVMAVGTIAYIARGRSALSEKMQSLISDH